MKKILSMVLVVLVALSLVACNSKPASDATTESSEGAAEKTKTASDLKLGFILGSREHAFYCSIEDGIKKAAEEMGFEAVVLESDLDGAVASQRIEDLAVDGCDAISLSVNDPTTSTPTIEATDKEGIPMFAFDCTSSETDVIKCFVGTDNLKGGEIAGEATIKYLEDNGLTNGATIGIIQFPGPQSGLDRQVGWLNVVEQYKEKYNLNIQLLGDFKGDASTAEQIMSDALVQYPDINVVFGIGDPAIVGALAAVKAAGAKTALIGFDANPEAHEAILDPVNGEIWVADVAQNPNEIGYKIAEQMVKYCLEGKVDAKEIMVSPYLVDKSNAIPQN